MPGVGRNLLVETQSMPALKMPGVCRNFAGSAARRAARSDLAGGRQVSELCELCGVCEVLGAPGGALVAEKVLKPDERNRQARQLARYSMRPGLFEGEPEDRADDVDAIVRKSELEHLAGCGKERHQGDVRTEAEDLQRLSEAFCVARLGTDPDVDVAVERG